MEPITTIAMTALVSSVVGAVVSSLMAGTRLVGRKIAERTDEERAMAKAMQAASRALLWRELQIIHAKAGDDAGMTVENRRHLESVYDAYHALGGNGTGTRLYEEAMDTPVLD